LGSRRHQIREGATDRRDVLGRPARRDVGFAAFVALVVALLARQAMSLRDNRRLLAGLHETVQSLNRRGSALANLAMRDDLTGLANRSKLAARLTELLREDGGSPALLYIDFDGFKMINDRSGHAAGDLVLIEAARRLSECVGEHSVLARLGGDEFVVLARSGHDEALVCARRILDRFAEGFFVDGEIESLTASIGIAIPPDGCSADDAIRLADAAMYAAKRAGKGRAVLYPDETLVLEPPTI
jgi:diguanylate cyclase (GGDEF)-like protein